MLSSSKTKNTFQISTENYPPRRRQSGVLCHLQTDMARSTTVLAAENLFRSTLITTSTSGLSSKCSILFGLYTCTG